MSETFEEFLARREKASNDYIRGDAGEFMKIATQQEPATFMPPSGALFEGVADTAKAHLDGAQMFGSGSTGRFQILQSGASGELGYWTGLQHANVELKGNERHVAMVLRTTEIFRKEGGAWRLVHRHADMLKMPD